MPSPDQPRVENSNFVVNPQILELGMCCKKYVIYNKFEITANH